MSFASAVSFNVLEQIEDLTPAWKCVEAELPSVHCLNTVKRPGFGI